MSEHLYLPVVAPGVAAESRRLRVRKRPELSAQTRAAIAMQFGTGISPRRWLESTAFRTRLFAVLHRPGCVDIEE
jgi:hypothetical protein